MNYIKITNISYNLSKVIIPSLYLSNFYNDILKNQEKRISTYKKLKDLSLSFTKNIFGLDELVDSEESNEETYIFTEENFAKSLRNLILSSDKVKWKSRWNKCKFTPVNHFYKYKREYNGRNKAILSVIESLLNYQDPRWLTKKQIEKMKGKLKKGSKAVKIIYANSSKSCYVAYKVYNASQTIGIYDKYIPEEIGNKRFKEMNEKRIDRIERIIKNSKVKISENFQNTAFYQSDTDTIVVPHISQFENVFDYYGTLLHELAHATAHNSRIGRSLFVFEEDKRGYSREEVIAEFSSIILSIYLELDVSNNTIDNISSYNNSIFYLRSFFNNLKDDDLVNIVKESEKVVKKIMKYETTEYKI